MFLFYCSSSFYHCNYLSNRRITMFGPTNNAACTPQSTSCTSACNLTAVSQFTLWANVPSGEVVSPSRWRLSPPSRSVPQPRSSNSPSARNLAEGISPRPEWQRSMAHALRSATLPPRTARPPRYYALEGKGSGRNQRPILPAEETMPLEREEETAIGKESISSPSPALRMSLHCRLSASSQNGEWEGGGSRGVGRYIQQERTWA